MRSFFAPENKSIAAQPEPQFSVEGNGIGSAVSTAWLRVLESSARLHEKILKKSEFNLWTSQRYVEAAALLSTKVESIPATDLSTQMESIHRQIKADIEPFIDEYSFLRASVVYEYDQNGVRNGYTESMSEIAHNFVEKMRTIGAPADRAFLEEKVAIYIEKWMANQTLAVGERLLCISPRGSQEELYPGLDQRHYVFVNIFEKTDNGFLLRQYRNYEPNKKLPHLQLAIATQTGGVINSIVTSDSRNPDHALIASAIHLDEHVDLATVTTVLYANKQSWPIDIDRDLPHLNLNEMDRIKQTMSDFCIKKFDELLQEPMSVENKITEFDQLIMLIKKAVLKWSETHASNYTLENKEIFELDLAEIEDSWKIQRKKARGEQLEKDEHSKLNTFLQSTQLDFSLPLKSAASWAHCISGSPLSLMKVANSIQSASFGGIALEGGSLQLLTSKEKEVLLTQLEQLVCIQVHGEVWYVPADYCENPGCYWDEKQQSVVGPCGIPLNLDSYAMNQETYNQLQERLQLEEYLGATELSTQGRTKIIALFSAIVHALIIGKASLEQNLLGDILIQENKVPQQLLEVYLLATQSIQNPYIIILSYITGLIKNSKTSKIEEIEESLPTSFSPSFGYN
ncbi:hypothetical protein KA082_02475 [Candidatus Woesebacteria bacterium]|nr:hypothetical protein [Candidatus Woesebacteria bacterium]